jgi:alpha/beta superfamily hydrolase
MVLAGQYLERSVVVRSGEISLDALYHRGKREPPCLMASPHPALGGSMTAPVIAELAWALTRAGHATMRFDYRGVGASQGSSRHAAGSLVPGARLGAEDLRDETEDLGAVADQLCATAHAKSICAVGYSFGASVVLAAADDARISHLVLVAPPTAIADFSAVARVGKPLLVVCAHHDNLCDRAALQALLPRTGKLEVLPHTDHYFLRGLTEMAKTVAAWLRGNRPEYTAPADSPEEQAPEARELELEEGEPLELEDKPKI